MLTCEFCSRFVLKGRGGGYCQVLNVSVQGKWEACPLFLPPFALVGNKVPVGEGDFSKETLQQAPSEEAFA